MSVQVLLKTPERLSSFFELSGFALAAAVSHGLDMMLPLFSGYLPGLWQYTVDALSTSCKVVTSNTACAACASTSQQPAQPDGSQQQLSQQQATHTGPGVGTVLLSLLDALPAMWQCHQALITQHCQQRQLYLEAGDDDSDLFGLSPMGMDSTPGSTPRPGSAGAAAAVASALHSQCGWLVHLLALGRCLHAEAGAGGCACIRAAAADRRLRLAWRACVEDVIKATRPTLPKVRAEEVDRVHGSHGFHDVHWCHLDMTWFDPHRYTPALCQLGCCRLVSDCHAVL